MRRPGSFRLAADEEEREKIRAEYEALHEDGFDADWFDEFPGFARKRSFTTATVHPARALGAPPRGARGRGRRGVPRARPVADVAALDAERVIVATDGYGRDLVPELADAIWPARGQSRERAARPGLYDRPHYARQGFDYWQQLPDRRVLLGGFRDVSIIDELTDVEETTPTIQASLDASSASSRRNEARICHRWAGIFGLTQDLLPLVGRVPGRDGLWVAAGYSGHGNVIGFARASSSPTRSSAARRPSCSGCSSPSALPDLQLARGPAGQHWPG